MDANNPRHVVGYGYVNGNKVNIRTGPGVNYPSVAKVNYGYQLKLLETAGNWFRIESKDGTVKGWISRKYVIITEG